MKDYRLIKKIWREERMPEEWKVGQIVIIYKKEDQQECKNYRGTLLNVAYKIMSAIIQSRLAGKAKAIIGQYQFSFTQGKSTIDAIHTIKQIMEKAHEHKMEIEMLFIDFQQAFDSVKRSKLMRGLKDQGIESKLRRLIAMTMNESEVNILTSKGESEGFVANRVR